jgi:hypothetical protein
MSIAEIQRTLADLPEKDRGTMAAWLLDSLPPHSPKDAAAEGIEEAARRRQKLDSGTVRPLTSDEFWADIDRQRAAWK